MNKQNPRRSACQKTSDLISYIIIGLALLILLWAILIFVKNGVNSTLWNYLLLFIICAIAYVLHYTKKDYQFIAWIKHKFPQLTLQKTLFAIMIMSVIIGIILRCVFIVIGNRYNPVEPLSDTGVHWFGGAMIAEDGHLSDNVAIYEGFFPYLITYSATLSVFINIFGQNVVAIIISNLLFDLIAALLLYVLLYKWQNRKVACIGVALWLLNPLEILYCSVGMAIVITNMFVVLAILLAFLCIQSYKAGSWRFLICAAALGISVGIGNSYRPLFSVFIIAVLITLLLKVIRRKTHTLLLLSGAAVMAITMLLTNITVEFGWRKVDTYSIGSTGVGWSFMLGANYDSWGKWNTEDSQRFGESLSQEEISGEDFLSIQQEFTQTGIDRYLAMTPWQIVTHLLHKTEVLFSDPNGGSLTWPVLEAYHISEENYVYKTLHGAGIMFLALFVVMAFIYLYHQFTQKSHDQTVVLLALCLCGLIAASLLVEVMWRYVMPIMVVLMILAATQITDIVDKIVHAATKAKISPSPPKTPSSSRS